MNEFNDLLRQIHKKPGLYLGKPSISSLFMFLNGYEFARRQLGIEPSAEESNLRDFQIWVQDKFEIKANQSWDQIILFHCMDEREAFEEFFGLLADFCRQVRTESAVNWLDMPNETTKKAFSTPSEAMLTFETSDKLHQELIA